MEQVWIIGAGAMAQSYMQVLTAQGVNFAYVSRQHTVRNAPWLHLEKALQQPLPPFVIIATPIETLVDVAFSFPAQHLLLEKPGGLNLQDVQRLHALTKKSTLHIAYNRRFLASVQEAKRRIAASELLSFHFEFNENAPLVESLPTPRQVKDHWLLANSSHVIDLAFYLGGNPVKLKTTRAGSLSWHQRGAYFSGRGETQSGAHFTYASDWRSAGRWGLELMLPEERLILKPLEGLMRLKKGTFIPEQVSLETTHDTAFKPGLYAQVQAFLLQDKTILPNLKTHCTLVKLITKIGGY